MTELNHIESNLLQRLTLGPATAPQLWGDVMQPQKEKVLACLHGLVKRGLAGRDGKEGGSWHKYIITDLGWEALNAHKL